MIDQTQLNTLTGYIQSSQNVVVLFKADATNDELATAVALAESLRGQGREVTIASPRTPSQEVVTQFPGLDQVTTELGNQNLVVGFDYNDQAVDKVSYHMSEDSAKFFLTIKPKKGAQPLDASSVEFSYTGFETDLLVLVGITNLEQLEQLYYGYEDVYKNTATVVLSASPTSVGHLVLTSVGSSSLSELTAEVLHLMNMDISSSAATQLLAAMEQETEGLQSLRATASTFETVARLLRLGARRTRVAAQPKPQKETVVQPVVTAVREEVSQDSKGRQSTEPLLKQAKKSLQRLQATTESPQPKPGSLKYNPSKNSQRTN